LRARALTAIDVGTHDDALPSRRACARQSPPSHITVYLANGRTIEHAHAFAAHETSRTTQLYDRRNDRLTPEEIERIAI
jgi:hypothetical protein